MIKIIVGRDKNADIQPESELVSRLHAELILEAGEWRLVDLGSANGTFHEKKRINSTVLSEGDSVRFADAEYVFLRGELVPRTRRPSAPTHTKPDRLSVASATAVVTAVALVAAITAAIFFSGSRSGESLQIGEFAAPPDDTEALIEKVKASTVWVECGWHQGSGFAIDWGASDSGETVILTNHHVIQRCIGRDLSVTVSTADFTARGSVSAYSPSDYVDLSRFRQDLALVTIGRFVPPLSRAESIGQGHWVMAVGNPQGLSGTVTTGSVARILDSSNTDILPFPADWILSNAQINQGNSGGPLVNRLGQVVGVNTLTMERFEGLGFANGWPNVCREIVTCAGSNSW